MQEQFRRLHVGEHAPKFTPGRKTDDLPPSGEKEAQREIQQVIWDHRVNDTHGTLSFAPKVAYAMSLTILFKSFLIPFLCLFRQPRRPLSPRQSSKQPMVRFRRTCWRVACMYILTTCLASNYAHWLSSNRQLTNRLPLYDWNALRWNLHQVCLAWGLLYLRLTPWVGEVTQPRRRCILHRLKTHVHSLNKNIGHGHVLCSRRVRSISVQEDHCNDGCVSFYLHSSWDKKAPSFMTTASACCSVCIKLHTNTQVHRPTHVLCRWATTQKALLVLRPFPVGRQGQWRRGKCGRYGTEPAFLGIIIAHSIDHTPISLHVLDLAHGLALSVSANSHEQVGKGAPPPEEFLSEQPFPPRESCVYWKILDVISL